MTADTAAYRDLRRAVLGLVREQPDRVDAQVPAAPDWRAHDVLAHLAGVCDDVLHGNLGGAGTDDWTAIQVEKRRSWDVDAVVEEWERDGEAVDALIESAPPGTFGQLLFDAWTHEQDLRGTFGTPGRRDSEAAACAYTWGAGILAGRDRDEGRAAMELVCPEASMVVGEPPVTSSVRVSRFDLLRSLTGRRSAAQIRGYEWTGTPDPDRLVFAPLFHLRPDDLDE